MRVGMPNMAKINRMRIIGACLGGRIYRMNVPPTSATRIAAKGRGRAIPVQ
jgi:hypothetical protein